ncbi:MAG TPA: hypothetical protein VJ673_20070 [Aromatoleum sp.]|uniref:hypothetical protein n=1 Tax=Aromatoleum sp. TaxID=2307007 RepID=UPI002B498211|nr:hypothetical protein [Aromatoleum sp.]HJV27988.1 hypothetical protein [Aromatoleum sp.]
MAILTGSKKNDTLNGGTTDDQLYGRQGNDVLNGGDGNDLLFGEAGSDSLNGGMGNDYLDGGTGADTMAGGSGNDIYVIDNIADIVTELANEGTDTVQSSISYTLGNNLENLVLTGTGNLSGTGNALANELYGNDDNNTLNGLAGADTMVGGDGDDTYVVDNVGDVVIENTGEGTDTVQSSVSYTLGANVENLTLISYTGAINGTGNALNNVINGNDSGNILDGAAGADTLTGGSGSDTYIVDNAGDIVIEAAYDGLDSVISSVSYTLAANVENLTLVGSSLTGTGNTLNNVFTISDASNTIVDVAGGGTDTVQSSVSYTLAVGSNVENLTLTGSAAINATGNELANVLTGNSAVNTLTGGLGNDTYAVSTGDVVIENTGEGTDTVQSNVSYTLGANVENLTLISYTGAINGTGNALNNVINGNDSGNILDGAAGADTLTGGSGSDTYIVDNAGDIVIEAAYDGLDSVISSVSYTLAANVENLTLVGTATINGIGNAEANTLAGNASNNVLTGGSGNDVFRFETALNASTNLDTITDFATGVDHIQLENAIFTSLTNTGTLNADWFIGGAGVTAAADANDYLIYNSTTGALYYDQDGNGAGQAVQFATLSGSPSLSASDFLIS